MNEPAPSAFEDEEPPERKPVDELKAWLRELKAYLGGALEDAGEASREKQAELRAEFERRTRHRED